MGLDVFYSLPLAGIVEKFKAQYPEKHKELIGARIWESQDRSKFQWAEEALSIITGKLMVVAIVDAIHQNGSGVVMVNSHVWEYIKPFVDVEHVARVRKYSGVKGYISGCMIILGPSPRRGFRLVLDGSYND